MRTVDRQEKYIINRLKYGFIWFETYYQYLQTIEPKLATGIKYIINNKKWPVESEDGYIWIFRKSVTAENKEYTFRLESLPKFENYKDIKVFTNKTELIYNTFELAVLDCAVAYGRKITVSKDRVS